MGSLILKSPHSFSIKISLSSWRWLTTGSLWLAFPKACNNNMTRRVRCRGDNDPVLNKQHFRRNNWACFCCSRQQTGGRSRWGFNKQACLSLNICETRPKGSFSHLKVGQTDDLHAALLPAAHQLGVKRFHQHDGLDGFPFPTHTLQDDLGLLRHIADYRRDGAWEKRGNDD